MVNWIRNGIIVALTSASIGVSLSWISRTEVSKADQDMKLVKLEAEYTLQHEQLTRIENKVDLILGRNK